MAAVSIVEEARLNRGQSRSKSGETKEEEEEEGVENRLANREALIQPRFPAKRQSGTNPRSPRPFSPPPPPTWPLTSCPGFLSPSAFTLSTATYRNQTRATSGRAIVSRAAHRRNFFDLPPSALKEREERGGKEGGFVTVPPPSSVQLVVDGFIGSS